MFKRFLRRVRLFRRMLSYLDAFDDVKVYLLPGGTLPERKTEGAVGYDGSIRAVVHPAELDPENPLLRKTIFDFSGTPEYPVRARAVVRGEDGELAYRLMPGESVLVGLGIAVELPPHLPLFVVSRSGLAVKHGITVMHAPLVDSDYRGEVGAFVRNFGAEPFDLRKGMRIAQLTFPFVVSPEFVRVGRHEDLVRTARGPQGFGSTG